MQLCSNLALIIAITKETFVLWKQFYSDRSLYFKENLIITEDLSVGDWVKLEEHNKAYVSLTKTESKIKTRVLSDRIQVCF